MTTGLRNFIRLPAVICVGLLLLTSLRADDESVSTGGSLMFPGPDQWDRVSAKQLGINTDAFDEALNFAMQRKSSSVVILHRGRILAERHQPVESPSLRYRSLLHGQTQNGHVIEDVASCQKSVTSVLVGIAVQKELVSLDDPVHRHLGVGWSAATPEQESQITLRHLISMSSGLDEQLKFVAVAGSKWAYNTNAYSRSLTVVSKAAQLSADQLTRDWLTDPLLMKDSKWIERQLPRGTSVAANRLGFATSARDLARFGLFVLAQGRWHDKQIFTNPDFLTTSTSPSQRLNPSYGYLWWLNGQKFVLRGTRRINGPLVSTAPKDMFAAQGALGRKCYVVPSAQLVIVRLGDTPDRLGQPKFDAEFWRLLRKAAPRK